MGQRIILFFQYHIDHQFKAPLRIMGAFFIISLLLGLSGCAEFGELAEDREKENYAGEGTIDPKLIPKFVEPLVIPPVMPPVDESEDLTIYHIAVKQFQQQVLPEGYPKTTVWGYGRDGDPLPGKHADSTFHFPAFTVETEVDKKVRVKWINGLVDEAGNYLPHLLPVDQTLHWANPAGTIDSRPTFTEVPQKYNGPVPIVTHVHGAHVDPVSDGYPEAWYLPNAKNIPAGISRYGTRYGSVVPAEPGTAIFEYTNDQNAATLWYHDHTLGITRLNVYAGPAGFWLIRDDTEKSLNLPGPAPGLNDPAGTAYYEIPIVIQDRTFNTDGSLFYPTDRKYFDDYDHHFFPEAPVSPIWNPEFFGNAIVVNGKTWPYHEVEPRLYRLRLLNGTGSRFLKLGFDRPDLVFNQIGSDGGLLPSQPLAQERILMGPAERFDVIVDFSALRPGEEIVLRNFGPDEPYKGLNPEEKQQPADPQTTGQIMKFRVVALTDRGNPGVIPMKLPSIERLETSLLPRDLTLNEEVYEEYDIPVAAALGTGAEGPLTWGAPVTENPMVGDVEIWRLINLTEDAHPIHLHAVMFQVLDRTPFSAEDYSEHQEEWLEDRHEKKNKPNVENFFTGQPKRANENESGWKDTVIANPGEVTRVIALFDLEGLYVWHCHILEHEDNEMMRPFYVGNIPEGSGLK